MTWKLTFYDCTESFNYENPPKILKSSQTKFIADIVLRFVLWCQQPCIYAKFRSFNWKVLKAESLHCSFVIEIRSKSSQNRQVSGRRMKAPRQCVTVNYFSTLFRLSPFSNMRHCRGILRSLFIQTSPGTPKCSQSKISIFFAAT